MATFTGDNNNNTYTGSAGDDDFNLFGGADSADGGAGNDTLFGGDGNDTLNGGSGDNELFGGNGDQDVAAFDGSFQDYTYAIDGSGNLLVTQTATGDVTLVSGIERISFSEGTFDLVLGTNGSDGLGPQDSDPVFIVAGDGTNNAGGSGNADVYFGGDGADYLGTGVGNDTIYAGGGEDGFSGDQGDDEIYAGGGNDGFGGGDGNDTLFGGDGNDGIGGDAGNDTLFGGDGDDSMGGGDNNDTLFGGIGNDNLGGDGGDDTLTLGAGNDVADSSRFGGADVVTDFDIGDLDGDGFYNDQLDVTDLRTLGGDPITTADVTPVDIGGGNVRLDFPEGESITLQGVSFAQMSSPAQLRAAGIPCFTAGTLIATPRGEVPVEDLRPGDSVLTRDNGFQTLRWTGMRALDAEAMKADPKLRPVRIAPNTFGNSTSVLFSQQHGVLVRDALSGTEHLIRAVHLAKLKGGGVRLAHGIKSITYVHLLFNAHQIILSGGIWSESFYPGPWAMRALALPQMQELATLFPELFVSDACEAYGEPARKTPTFQQLSGRAQASGLHVQSPKPSIPSWQG